MTNPQSKIALVTGANRGLGLEAVRQLAKHREIEVILTSRSLEKGKAAVAELQKHHRNVHFHALDVNLQGSIDHLAKFVAKEFGRLDILINNAGIFAEAAAARGEVANSILETPIETIHESLETNTYGPIRLAQAFVPLMKKNHYGRIVNISSGMGQLSEMNGGWPGYRISKTALNAVTRILADELKGTNILVNSVCPGWVRTDMGGPNAERSLEEGVDTIVWLALLPDGGPSGGFFRDRQPIEW